MAILRPVFLRALLFAVILLTHTSLSNGQDIRNHILKSRILGDSRQIQVYLPNDYDSKRKYATIYVFDGNYLFNPVWAAAEFEVKNEKIPPAIVIGIHFKENGRNFDMGIDWESGELDDNGKRFYQYVKQELIPFVDSKYSSSGHSTIIGHSNSSTFLNYFLFDAERPVFNNYVALSQVFVGNVEQEFARLFASKLQGYHYYYVGIAGRDSRNRIDNPRQTEKTIIALKKPDKLLFQFEEFGDADHGSVFLRGLPNALEFGFQEFAGMSSQWRFVPGRETFCYLATGETIAAFFNRLKTDPLDFAIKERKRASEIFNLQLGLSPGDLTLLGYYATDLKDKAFLDRVVLWFEREYPDNDLVLQYAAQQYRRIGAWKEMEEYFWKFNDLPTVKGKQPYAYNYLFHSYDYFMKDPDKAWDLLEKYRKAFPENNRVNLLFGKISVDYNVKKELGEAALVSFLDAAKDDANAQKEGLMYLGRLYLLQGNKENAATQFRTVLKIDPDSKEAVKWLLSTSKE